MEPQHPDLTKLRAKAEARIKLGPAQLTDLSSEEVVRVVHELQTHQIELELQNEELRLAQGEVAALRDEYQNLYDSAPVGYLTVSEKGLIEKANRTIGEILRREPLSLINGRVSAIIVNDDQDTYYRFRCEVLYHSLVSPLPHQIRIRYRRILRSSGVFPSRAR